MQNVVFTGTNFSYKFSQVTRYRLSRIRVNHRVPLLTREHVLFLIVIRKPVFITDYSHLPVKVQYALRMVFSTQPIKKYLL